MGGNLLIDSGGFILSYGGVWIGAIWYINTLRINEYMNNERVWLKQRILFIIFLLEFLIIICLCVKKLYKSLGILDSRNKYKSINKNRWLNYLHMTRYTYIDHNILILNSR